MKFLSVTIIVFAAIAANAQVPAARSHVERFSTPEARALKIEQEATDKLAKKADDADVLNERALARLRLQKFAEAYEDLRRASELNPKNADFRANLGYALWKLGRFAEAVQAERDALKLDEKNYTANYQLGRFLLRSGDKALLKEATEKLKRALEIDSRQYEVRFELIAAYREVGDTASALAQLDILQDAKPADARVSYVSGLLFVDRGDFKSAEKSLTDAIQKDPNLFGARQDLGLLYAKLERWPEAVTAFSELAKKQQNSVEVAYLVGLSLYNANRPADAESEVRRALRIDAGSADAHTLLGIILAAKVNGSPEAIESLTQAVAIAPANFDAVFNLGRLQYLSRDFPNALKNLQNAVSLRPMSLEARFFFGTALEAAGEPEKALSEYQEIVKLDEKSFYGKIGLGALAVKQGRLDDAVVALSDAISAQPNSFEANWALGRALLLQEKFETAADALRKAVELQPNRTDARYQFAIALRRLGKAEDAKREFDLVEKLNREFREGKTP